MKKSWVLGTWFWVFGFGCLLLGVLFSVLFSGQVLAEEATPLGEVVVTATRTPEALEKVPSSVTVITAKELKEKGIETLTDALREAPGLNILQNGFGGLASTFLRGAENGQSVILIDGVPVYDPSGTAKGDFSSFIPHLSVDEIDRIEIVRGPQSVLYGSNAMAGAINIITKRAQKTGAFLAGEYGSYRTFFERASFNLARENTSLSLSLSKKDSKGMTKMLSEPDTDAYHNGNVAAKLTHAFNERLAWGASFLFSQASHDLDGGNQKEKNNLGFFKTNLDWQVTPQIKQHLDFSLSSTRREYDQGAGGLYKGRLTRFSWQSEFLPKEPAKFIAGFDYQKEKAEIDSPWGAPFDETAYEWAPFAEAILDLKKAVLTLGVRYTKHETAGDKVTYRVAAAAFPVESIKLHASYGTGFRTPGLFQLYDPSYGNKDLKPEKSWGYDAGVTFYAPDQKASLDLTYFYNKFEDMIDLYPPYPQPGWWNGKYINLTGYTKTYGVEATAEVRLFEWLKLSAAYQCLSAKKANDEDLDRRPRNKASLAATFYLPEEKGSLTFRGLYVGRYKDGSHEMGKYFVAYLSGIYNVNKSLSLSARIDNLFDKDYQEVYDYKTPGRSIYVGLSYRW
ncbi:TonB-dependent receptor plug domain-containing protein [Thermodesulfatator atlanticus]|uniref:TonB-dependent receptor plug domain-containing protein n=1 Tax=Thermodesulfatator atlanticus TaxID=501497 RepID=UPI0003B597C2|nr:TonB-dependent receptor [Thermodesulfatator atlanticus]